MGFIGMGIWVAVLDSWDLGDSNRTKNCCLR